MFQQGNISPKPIWLLDEPYSKGVVNAYAARFLEQGAAVELQNVDLQDPARPRKRYGYLQNSNHSSGLAANVRINGLGQLRRGPGASMHVVSQGQMGDGGIFVRSDPNSPRWVEATTDAGSSFAPAGEDVKFLQADDLLFCIPGAGQPVHVVKANAKLIDCGDTIKSPPPGPTDGAWMFLRVWFLTRNQLFWSKILPTASELADPLGPSAPFDRSLNVLRIDPPFGGVAKALVPWRGRYLLAFYETGIVSIQVDNSSPETSIIEVIEPQFGLIGRDAWAVVGHELFFMDQYYQIRSLVQTITSTNQGMTSEPLSQSVDKELPDRVNPSAAHKTRIITTKNFLQVYYCRDSSTEVNARMTFDLARKYWFGPDVFANTFSKVMVSQIMRTGEKIYATDGSTTPGYYRFEDSHYTDNGTAITYRETPRQLDFNSPFTPYHLRYVELEGKSGGQVGAFQISARSSENDEFSLVAKGTLANSSDSDLPLQEVGTSGDDFPLQAGDFPLTEVEPQIVRARFNLESPQEGSFPLYSSAFPLYTSAFEILGEGRVIPRGRFMQFQIEESVAGSRFERHGWRAAVFVENPTFAD